MSRNPNFQRLLPIGAEVIAGEGVHFCVWAPSRERVEVVLESGAGSPGSLPLSAEPGGYFSALVPAAGAGTLYRYRLDGDESLYADPASRFQPTGPHGPSEVIDPTTFRWTDADWP